jgi:hypothetical protein
VSFAVITLCVAFQRVYFFIDSVRKLLDTPSFSNVTFGKSPWYPLDGGGQAPEPTWWGRQKVPNVPTGIRTADVISLKYDGS